MGDLLKGRNNFHKRYSKIINIFLVLIPAVVSNILLTAAYNSQKEKEIIVAHKTLKQIRIKHPIYHHTFKSTFKSIETHVLGKYTIFTNSLGFKDESSRNILLKSKNHRILFIGDSFTEGVVFDYKNIFVGI